MNHLSLRLMCLSNGRYPILVYTQIWEDIIVELHRYAVALAFDDRDLKGCTYFYKKLPALCGRGVSLKLPDFEVEPAG